MYAVLVQVADCRCTAAAVVLFTRTSSATAAALCTSTTVWACQK